MKDISIGIASFFKGLKPSLLLSIIFFVIGMVVPGVCGLAFHDIELFKEIKLIRLILISIGISSPSLIISLNLAIGIYDNFEDENSIESILLFSGFMPILVLTFTTIVIIFSPDVDIKKIYLYFVTLFYLLSFITGIIGKSASMKKERRVKTKSNLE